MSDYQGSNGSISIETNPDGTSTITVEENGPPKKKTVIKVKWRGKRKRPKDVEGEEIPVYTGINDQDCYYYIYKLDMCDFVFRKYCQRKAKNGEQEYYWVAPDIRIKGIPKEKKEDLFNEMEKTTTEYTPEKLKGIIIKSAFEVYIPLIPKPGIPLPKDKFKGKEDKKRKK
jgi:hypothetical protein